jgi:hypothetical protein
MGKSNKFDFSNRPSSGVKLGHSIASVLTKDAEKILKDVEKAASRARKHSTGSSSADTKDLLTHHIDIQAPNKELTNDGVAELATGLKEALEKGTSVACLNLEELNLSGNGLTTASLARLAPIIELAKYDLKTLNLSNNRIAIVTDQESREWEVFLKAFRSCRRLRLLDLSKNSLGSRAMEVLARTYLNEPLTDPGPLGGEASAPRIFLNDEHPLPDSDDDPADGSSAFLGPTGSGLRSITLINLDNIGLNDTGALWLSYVLEEYIEPNVPAHAPEDPRMGVTWAKNDATLGRDGRMVLQKTEHERRMSISAMSQEESSEESMECIVGSPASRGRSGSRSFVGHGSELESIRKRLQRHIIESDGAKSIGLWRAALKTINFSRMLLCLSPQTHHLYAGERLLHLPSSNGSNGSLVTSNGTSASGDQKRLYIDTTKASAGSSYAATLTSTGKTVGEPELAITEVTNTPATPKLVFKPHRKGAFSEEGLDVPSVTARLNGLIIRDDGPERYIKHQQKMHVDRDYRDTVVASHWPRDLIERVIDYAMPGNELPGDEFELMTEKQKRQAVDWGQSREALRMANDWRKKDESSQVWMLLDAVKCLAYGD